MSWGADEVTVRYGGRTALGAVSVEANTTGTVFRLKTDGSGFTILHKFAQTASSNQDGNAINTDGAYPESALIQGPDGYLYGMTKSGGPNGTGAVYKMSTDGSSFTVLHNGVLVQDHVANPGGEATDTVTRLHRIDPAVVRRDFEKAGFVFDAESHVLEHAQDDHTKPVFDPAVRGQTDQFVYRFRKPAP